TDVPVVATRPVGDEEVGGTRVRRTVAALGDVADAGGRPAQAGALRVRGASESDTRAVLRHVAGTGGGTALEGCRLATVGAAVGDRGDERAGGRAAGGRAAVARALVAVLARVGGPVSARGDHGGEALAEDAIVAAVLEVALPDDDEVARRVRSDGGERLRIVRLRVDPELGALRYPAAAE